VAEVRFLLGAFAVLCKVTISFVITVRPFAWNTSVPTGQMLMKFDIGYFSKIYLENSSFIKI
jgi:hypothetical protein